MKNLFIIVALILSLPSFAQTHGNTVTGQQATSFGTSAGTQEKFSTFFGYQAGRIFESDQSNSFFGYKVGVIGVGSYNSYYGYETGLRTTGSNNAFYGLRSGKDSNGNGNSFFGKHSGLESNGNENLILGNDSGLYQVGNSNLIVGKRAGRNLNGSSNVLIGFDSGLAASGTGNIFLGNASGANAINANRNIAIGANTGDRLGGEDNVFIGNEAGRTNKNGSKNVFLGFEAGRNELGSNLLYIDNSATPNPLVYGDFSGRQLGVNTSAIPTGFTMAVRGKMITEELKIQTFGTTDGGVAWPDYVFEDTYYLPTLKEVETYIKNNGHLENVPSAKEVEENGGVLIGEMNAKLLRKIEELTLYTIQQDKEIQKQKEINANLEERLKKLESLIKD